MRCLLCHHGINYFVSNDLCFYHQTKRDEERIIFAEAIKRYRQQNASEVETWQNEHQEIVEGDRAKIKKMLGISPFVA